jgi:hypothetical protein
MYRTPEATSSAVFPRHIAWTNGWMRIEACGPTIWAPEQQAGPGVGENLHETARVLQRPAVSGVVVRASGGNVRPSLCLQVLLGSATGGDLRIGEHGGRHDREDSLPEDDRSWLPA